MNKQEILSTYKKEEDKILIAKILDKLEYTKTKNKINNTQFLDIYQKNLIKKLLNRLGHKNYIFFGGSEISERTSLIFYPDKFNERMIERNYKNIMSVVEIILPNELKNKYTHRDYLGGLMKLGIKREKIGDIVVFDEGADIVVLNEISEFVKENISSLTRFSKSNISIKEIYNLHTQELKTEDVQIMVSSMRLDNIVSELIKTSRAKAEEIIKSDRVFVNFENIIKDSKILKEGDTITIRGKGRFKIEEVIGNTKKGKFILRVEKYI